MTENRKKPQEAELHFEKNEDGDLILREKNLPETLTQDVLYVTITTLDGSRRSFPVFRQAAGNYGEYSEYMKRHGCACCSLTTLLAAYREEYTNLRPNDTACQVEKEIFGEALWLRNYRKHIARQMPVSLYGISRILEHCGIPHRYVGAFQDEEAEKEIHSHLLKGCPVVIETSRMKRNNGRIVRFMDKKYAGSYHTMILLGIDCEGQVIFTDSAHRDWAGNWQRLKKAELTELISYMFPRKNEADTHVYFSRRKNTGGYLLIEE